MIPGGDNLWEMVQIVSLPAYSAVSVTVAFETLCALAPLREPDI